MKSLFTLAFVVITTTLLPINSHANVNKDTTTFIIHYDAILSDPYQENLQIEVYEFDTVEMNWVNVMRFNSESSYLTLDRSKGYQIWMSEENESKVFCIQPGYTGDYVYRIHANFNLELCVLMVPEKDSYRIEYVEFDVLIPYIYQDKILD